MAMVTKGPLKDVYFGFDAATLYLRIDLDRPAMQALPQFDRVRIGFIEPPGVELAIHQPCRDGQRVEFTSKHAAGENANVQVGIGSSVETGITFNLLGVHVGQPIHFYVELLEGNQSRDRAHSERDHSSDLPVAGLRADYVGCVKDALLLTRGSLRNGVRSLPS